MDLGTECYQINQNHQIPKPNASSYLSMSSPTPHFFFREVISQIIKIKHSRNNFLLLFTKEHNNINLKIREKLLYLF